MSSHLIIISLHKTATVPGSFLQGFTTNTNTMNKKSEELNRIIDTVIRCCVTSVSEDDTKTFTRSDVMGASHSMPLVMTRCLVVGHLVAAGFSVATIASVLNRSPQGIRNLMRLAISYHRTSRAYRIAEDEADTLLHHDGN